MTTIPTDDAIVLESGDGHGSVSSWLWREKYSESNWGIFHDNDTDTIRFVGQNNARVDIALGSYSLKVGGNEVITTGNISSYVNSGGSGAPYGFSLASTDWTGVPGTFITDWSHSSGADMVFKYNSGALNVVTDGYFYQGIDYRGSSYRVIDEYDLVYGTTFIYNCGTEGGVADGSSTVSVNDLAAAGCSTVGMIYGGTDQPCSGWKHVWSQAWTKGSISNLVSQIALGTSNDWGMYYRCGSGSAVGRGWYNVLDNSGTSQTKSGSLTASSFYMSSDRRLKKNIQNIPESSLDDLFDVSDKLIKKFTFKTTGKDSYGFIAQQLEQYIPEAVSIDANDIKSVSYDVALVKIVAALVHKVKALQEQMSRSAS